MPLFDVKNVTIAAVSYPHGNINVSYEEGSNVISLTIPPDPFSDERYDRELEFTEEQVLALLSSLSVCINRKTNYENGQRE